MVEKTRTKSALITLIIGLTLNIALGASKLAVGLLSDSASVTSDAANNISDAAVSVMTIVATYLAARAADHDHPYGHGRYEYIAAFVLGAVITVVGAEVFITGIERAVTPTDTVFGIATWVVLGCSIAVKLAMAGLYGVRARAIGSDVIKAAAVDSASDAAVTSMVTVCAAVEYFTGVHIDGYASIAVAVVIVLLALRILKSTLGKLLGGRSDAELYSRIREILLESERVISVHDVIVNDYGAAQKIAAAHVVFSAEMSFVDVHAECDSLERSVKQKTGVSLCIHADPYITDDTRLVGLRESLERVLEPFGATAHDVYIDDEEARIGLDITVPDDKTPKNELIEIARAEAQAVADYEVDIKVDYI